jgi:hypothetical protein
MRFLKQDTRRQDEGGILTTSKCIIQQKKFSNNTFFDPAIGSSQLAPFAVPGEGFTRTPALAGGARLKPPSSAA